MPQKIKVPGDLRTRAAFDPTTFNAEERTVEVTFGTEAKVRMYGFYETLSFRTEHAKLERLNAGANLLDNHTRYGSVKDSVLGVVERAWIANNEGRALVRFSARPEIAGVIADVKDGILKNISCGYRVYAYERQETGEDETPHYLAVDWEPFEISIVPVPADHNAQTRAANDEFNEVQIINNSKTPEMPNTKPVPAAGEENARAATPEATPPVVVDQTRAAAPAADVAAQVAAGIAAERQRSADIMTATTAAGLSSEFAQTLISEGKSIDQARALIIDEFAKGNATNTRSANVTVTADEADKTRSAIVAGLVLRSGLSNDLTPAEIEAGRQYRAMSLLSLAAEVLTARGESVRGLDQMELAKRAISSHSSDFPILLEGAARRTLLAAYTLAADTWRQFCAVGSVGDFREYSRLRFGGITNLDKVQENGEYVNKKISDATAEKVSVDTFGNIISLSRKMIVNDDLNAFARATQMLGRAAARSIETDVYKVLASNPVMADGLALFHADHGNIVAGSAISVAAFDGMRQKMALQKDEAGVDFLDLRPSLLLCSVANGGEARVINDSQYDPDVANKLQRPNKVRGLFKTVVDSPRITGNEYYGFANPAEEPVIEVSFLNGVQTPHLESEEAFNTDGIRWKIRHDYGVGAVGYKGAVKNPGV